MNAEVQARAQAHARSLLAVLGTAQRHGQTALRRVRERAGLYALATGCTALALTLPMVLLLIVQSVGDQVDDWRESYYFTVYLDPAVDDAEGEALAAGWRDTGDVRNTTLITRAQAAADFAAATGAGDLIAALGENPLPVVIQVWPALAQSDTDEVLALVARLRDSDGVDEIDTDLVWLERANAVHATLQRASWLVAALLAVIAVALVGSHIRQQLAALSDEIALSKLIGATDSTLRAPFWIGGALIGLFAGLLAAVLAVVTLGVLADPVAAIAASYQSNFELRPTAFWALVPYVLASVVIGVIGAGVAIETRLRRIQPA